MEQKFVDPTPLNNKIGIPLEVLDRFLAMVSKEGHGGCWIWTGYAQEEGYGRFRFGEQGSSPWRVHRLSYELTYGPLDRHRDLHHKCENKLCVNPKHLEPETRKDHAAIHAAKITHCPHGHEYTAENTWIVNGKRDCRECSRINSSRYYYEKRRAKECSLNKTHCRAGHELAPDNVVMYKSPKGLDVRLCLTCRRASSCKKKPRKPKP